MHLYRVRATHTVIGCLWLIPFTSATAPAVDTLPTPEQLAAGDVAAITRLCDQLVAPTQRGGESRGDDTAARQALHGLAIQVSRPGAQQQRRKVCGAFINALQSVRTKPVQAFLLRELRFCADEDAVPALRPLLTDQTLCGAVTRTLLTIGTPAAADALARALPDAQGAARLTLTTAVGTMRADGATATLLQDAQAEDRELRLAAGHALANIGTPEAADTLHKATTATTLYERSRANESYLLLLRRLAEADHQAEAVQRAASFMKERPDDTHIQCAGLDVLSVAHTPESIDLLAAALRHEQPRIRESAKRLVIRVQDPAMTQRLIAMLPQSAPQVQVSLLQVLSQRDDLRALPAVKPHVDSEHAEERQAAIAALGRLGGAQAVKDLVPLLQSADTSVSTAAAAALTAIPDTAATDLLAKQARKPPATLQASLLGVLAARRAKDHIPLLFEMAGNADADVRAAALQGLGQLAGVEQYPRLVQLLVGAGSDADRTAAQKALVASCRRIVDPAVCAPPLLEAIPQASTVTHCALLRVLGTAGGDAALTAVQEASASANGDLHATGVRVLAEWPDTSALAPLRQLAETSQDQVQQILTLRGYIRLLGLATDRMPDQRVTLYAEAMGIAQRDDEKKLVLAGLGNVKHAKALETTLPFLDEPKLRPEAAAAVVDIADSVRGTAGANALRKVLVVSTDDRLKKRAQSVLNDIEKYHGCIVAWQMSGAYSEPGKSATDLFDIAFAPERPDADEVKWKEVKAAGDGQLDLAKALGGSQRAAYMQAIIVVPTATDARLEVGSDDAVKVWLNGKVIHANNVMRAFTWAEDKIDVSLNSGRNILMLKVTQGGGGWVGSARVRKPDGSTLTDLGFE